MRELMETRFGVPPRDWQIASGNCGYSLQILCSRNCPQFHCLTLGGSPNAGSQCVPTLRQMCPRRSSEAGEVARRAGGVMNHGCEELDPSVRCADTSPREAWGGTHELLVWIDQKLLAGRALVVDGDVLEIEHLRQGDHLRVVARHRPRPALPAPPRPPQL